MAAPHRLAYAEHRSSHQPVMPAPAPHPPRWTWLPLSRGSAAEPVARGWLGTQLALPKDRLPLLRDEYGRPQLDGAFHHWDCNWSHSGDGLLVALAHHARVGIDLEWIRPRPRALELARRFFTSAEADALAAMSPAGQQEAFLRLWCAKEAVLKAHGRGLAFGLDKLAFDLDAPGLRLSSCDAALGDPAQWSLLALEPAAGYLGALAWRRLA